MSIERDRGVVSRKLNYITW